MSKKILVVDDNPVNRKIAEKLLTKYGYDVNFAKDGQDALKTIAKVYHDLVLMDIEMPKLNGFDTTSQLRNPRLKTYKPKLPIIGFSSMDSRTREEIEQKCLEVGMQDFLKKPAKPDELVDTIENYIHVVQNTDIEQSLKEVLDDLLKLLQIYVQLYYHLKKLAIDVSYAYVRFLDHFPTPKKLLITLTE